MPRQGWRILGIIDDISEVAWKLDLAFGYRSFDVEGAGAPRTLLHAKAYELLKNKRAEPPQELIKSVRLWRFFSEYDVHATDFVALMQECNLPLEEIIEQVNKFFAANLTSQYREGQYPPYFINDKKTKEFKQAVKDLLRPMDAWLLRNGTAEPEQRSLPGRADRNPKRTLGFRPSGQ